MGTKKTRSARKFEVVEALPPKAGVIAISKARHSSTTPYIQYHTGDNGSDHMFIVYPALLVNGVPWEQNISFLLKTPQLAAAMADALIYRLGSTPNLNTAKNRAIELKLGFVAYLEKISQSDIDLTRLSIAILKGFMNWLDAERLNGKPRWAEITCSRMYNQITDLLEALLKMKQWRTLLPSDLHIPQGHWTGLNRGTKGVEALTTDLVTRIRLACIVEARDIMERFRETQELCAQHRGRLAPIETLPRMDGRNGNPVWTRDLIVLYADQLCSGGPILGNSSLLKRFPGLGSQKLASATTKLKFPLLQDVAPRFHPTSRTIVPFVLLMAIAFAYNPDTLRNSQLDDFGFSTELGKFFVANAYKGRAGSEQRVFIPADDETDNPALIFRFLLAWTARLRPHVNPAVKNNLFIYSKLESGRVSAFNEGQHRGAWDGALDKFRQDHNLEHFTLEQIRITVLDLAFETFEGDIKDVQTHANHKSVNTTSIYTSTGERQRQHERLGRTIAQRTRHRETNGVIDGRNRDKSEDLDCATPGWNCLSPYDSPYSESGKLCDKYGWCPICPLATLNMNSPLSFAYSIALLEAVNRGQANMDPQSWLKRLGPINKKLAEHWLPAFKPTVIEKARELHIPPLPTPE